MQRSTSAIREIVKGAAAGAAATWAMGLVTNWLYAREDRRARGREDVARGGGTAYGNAAESAAQLAGGHLTRDERERVGSALHWATGIAAGASYALLRRKGAALASGRGLGFGTAFFLGVDEALNTALGFTPGPTVFPWQTHARGLAGHLAFGLATDTALRLLDHV